MLHGNVLTGCLRMMDGSANGISAQVLRDTGCTMIGIKDRFIYSQDYLPATVQCKTISGQIITLQTAKVDIRTPYLSGKVTACVIPKDAVADIIIGNVPGVTDCKCKETTSETFICQVCTRAQSRHKEQTPLRVPQIEMDFDVDNFRAAQKADDSLAACFKKLQQEPIGGIGFQLRNDLLYRVHTSDKSTTSQLVVPVDYRNRILQLGHEIPMAGHQGCRRTKMRIVSRFFWPGMYKHINKFVKSCDICQRTSTRGHCHRAPTQPVPIVTKPFGKISIDLVGPLIKSDRGHRYILTITDFATRWPEAVPLKEISTEKVAEALVTTFSRLGIPDEVLSDRGTQFVSDVMSQVWRMLGIQHIKTSPYHPQSNGLCERFNGTLKAMLRKVCASHPADWDRYLPSVLFAYRELPQDSTKCSPFELMYGRTPKGPMAVLRDLLSGEQITEEVRNTYKYVVDLETRIAHGVKLAQDNYKKSAEGAREHVNKTSKLRELKVGDKVLVFLPETTNKLLLRWKGPFEVIKKHSKVNYVILIKGIAKSFHINMMKKYEERAEQSNVLHTVAIGVIQEATDTVNDINVELVATKPQEGVGHCQVNQGLTRAQRREVDELLQEFQSTLSDLPGKTDLEEHNIRLYTESPIYTRQYPLPIQSEDTMKEEVNNLLKLGIIERANSEYASPVVLVKKSGGGMRMCLDFRAINKETVPDREPIPNQEELFAKLSKARIFSRTDLSRGYHQIPLAKDSKKVTAFPTPLGLMQYKYMPFGLVNAPATFARMMRKLLDQCPNTTSYFDDILIFTDTWEQHMEALRRLLLSMRAHGLTAKPSKTFIGFREIDFLGHVVTGGKISPQKGKMDQIFALTAPTTKKQVKSLLGLIGYYRKFVPHFATLTFPLTELLAKGSPNKVVWTKQCQVALCQIQRCFSGQPILRLPDVERQFVVRCDASDVGIGAALLQWHDSLLMPCAFASRKLLDRERNYPIIERECLAIVFAVTKFERLLLFSRFVVQTDHKPLLFLAKGKTSNSRLMRWALALQQFSFSVQAIAGNDNYHADVLSRLV